MKIRNLLLIVLLSNGFEIIAQGSLRDFVVIVKPTYHESTTKFLKEYSERLKNHEYNSSADFLKTFIEGKGFGSGFFVKANNGKVYLLTNKHVVLQAATVTAEFSKTDGSSLVYEGGTIVSIAENEDLALIAFPDETNIKNVLQLSDVQPEDGNTIFSAGYPGMAGKPSWQLSMGIISNAAFHMENLDEENKTTAIQHTAQIDRGSSGSPLLVADKNQKLGYAVIGLNTWKIKDRENVNLAIPSSAIAKFIRNATKNDRILTNDSLERTSIQFASDISHGYKNILKYISYDYISKLSVDNFYSFFDHASEDVQNDISMALNNGHPIEAVRIALANAIYMSIAKNKNDIQFSSIKGNISVQESSSVIYLVNQKPVNCSWIIEQNSLKINSFSSLKIFDINKSVGKSWDFGYDLNVGADLAIPFTAAEKTGYGLEFEAAVPGFNKAFLGASLHKYSHLSYKKEFDYDLYKDIITDTGFSNYSELCLNLGFQYPLQISKLFFIPYIKGSIGAYMGDVSLFIARATFGLKTAYEIDNRSYLIFNFGMASRTIKDDGFFGARSDTYDGLLNTGNFGNLYLGLSYAFRIDFEKMNTIMMH